MYKVIAAFLMAVIVPLVVKVFIGLGLGFISYTGADFAISQAESYINTTMGVMPSNMYNIIAMAGFVQGLSIVFAGYSAYIGVRVATSAFTKMTITKPV